VRRRRSIRSINIDETRVEYIERDERREEEKLIC